MPWNPISPADKCPTCGRRREEIYSTPAAPDKPAKVCKVCAKEHRTELRAAKGDQPAAKTSTPKAAPKKSSPAKNKAQFGHESGSRNGPVTTRKIAA